MGGPIADEVPEQRCTALARSTTGRPLARGVLPRGLHLARTDQRHCLHQQGAIDIIEYLVAEDDPVAAGHRDTGWRELLADEGGTAEDWRILARRGGFPTPALELATPSERRIWFDGYVRTYFERLPAYAVNRTMRLIKAPKIYWGDTGVAMHLAEGEEPAGAHLENVVLHDLLAWRDARIERAVLSYWRTSIGEEVDFVIEAGGKLLPIEVKSTARPRLSDAALLLHTGNAIEWLAPDVLAAPWWMVL